ncbi:FecR domain-containing protein [Sphingomonas sp. HF-S3]|uniref:FecR domain-containing protein n=1 Tax=Sphingomonas rustica TaxID=3103142 RepID=A0ABV0BBQ8_9SPHN
MFRGEPENANRQAADWLARLHADDRAPGDEAAFRAWLKADASHADAFDRASGIWDAVGGLRGQPVASAPPAPERLSRRAVLAGGGALVVASGLTLGWQDAHAGTYRTGIGEQRRLVLDDGTRVMLDTDTSIRFRARDDVRTLSLTAGRIDIDIAADPRPFVIEAGERRATAQAARLDLRREGDRIAFTAIQGSARILSAGTEMSLTSGNRIAMAAGRADRLDRPEIEDLVAWQSGRLAFRDETVARAAAEMNRYSRRALVVSDARVAAMRLSGVYRVGDPEAFARSLALLLPVRVTADDDAIRIQAAG